MCETKNAKTPKHTTTITNPTEKAKKLSKVVTIQKGNSLSVPSTTSKTNKVVAESHNPNISSIALNCHLALVVYAREGLLKYRQSQFGDVCTLINVPNTMVNVFTDEDAETVFYPYMDI